MLRFGRKLPLPSTMEIKHELRRMMAADAFIEEARAALEGHVLSTDQIGRVASDLAAKFGLSVEIGRELMALIETRTPQVANAA